MHRPRIALGFAVAFGVAVLAASAARPAAQTAPPSAPMPAPSTFVAHEWGTFTTVANEQGNSTEWIPLSGHHDLPCFVDYFNNREVKVLGPNYGSIVNYEQAKTRLRGSVRMETPVIYFYADRDLTVDVAVKFPVGLFTEWYPAATVAQVTPYDNLLPRLKNLQSEMKWKNVRIEPSAPEAFPADDRSSHYYAARATDASPLRVGNEQEKFLFYRGVGAFPVPISTTVAAEDSVIVKNLGKAPLTGVVLFSRQGGDVSFKIYGTLEREITLTTSPRENNVDELKAYLHKTLVETGLYPREAQAMLDTWGDTWFEEGTRVFYVVPPSAVDEILPLTITPKPSATARAFVGRVEVITPAMEAEVARAFEREDTVTLDRYGRLIGPIGDRLMARAKSLTTRVRISNILNDRLRAFATAAKAC